jgi:hypothetical protein
MFTRAQKRFYGRCMSGLATGKAARFLTLTSSDEAPSDIHRSFRVLKERIRRRCTFEYVCVCEIKPDGRKHLHIAYHGSYLPQAWISKQWLEIHNSPVVWIEKIRQGKAGARYLTKYVGKEQNVRWWGSWGWIYRGWRIIHHGLFANLPNSRFLLTFSDRVAAWEAHLQGRVLWLNSLLIPHYRSVIAIYESGQLPCEATLAEKFGLIAGYVKAF